VPGGGLLECPGVTEVPQVGTAVQNGLDWMEWTLYAAAPLGKTDRWTSWPLCRSSPPVT
jgi:hypothetical protein